MKVTKEKRKVNVIMGMAAGQARLLSITSRMSDNELRAQLINNDKMRLATKSAQVSEAYTTALNEAQLMFTNYDKDNNSSYKELTFNSLTAYNQYNNQYAISNAAGQLLVSETDAKNFQKSNDLNSFLACYGLEQTTTYFSETLSKYQNIKYTGLSADGKYAVTTEGVSNGVVYNSDLIFPDANGTNKSIQIDSGWTAKMLEQMYNGVNGYSGYMNTITSPDYYEYTGAVASFNSAQEAFETSIAEKANELLSKGSIKVGTETRYLTTDATKNGKSFNDLSAELADSSSPSGTLDNIIKLIDQMQNNYTNERGVYENQKTILNNIKQGKQYIDVENLTWDPTTKTLSFGEDLIVKKDDNGTWSATATGEDDDGVTHEATATSVTSQNGVLTVTFTEDENNTVYTLPDPTYNNGANLNNDGSFKTPDDPSKYMLTGAVDADDMKTIGQQVLNYLKNSFVKNINQNHDIFKNSTEFKNYESAAKNLYKVIFGQDSDFASFPSDKWSSLTDVNAITDSEGNNLLGQQFANVNNVDFAAKYAKIKQAVVLNYIMDTYGEPNFTWIDKTDKNANGTAKAQWYTNLYNKMQSSGYKTLHDGLASSTEWIKFAFESGLVCLEQVDSNNNWNSTTYTNCSDITEQTNNAALTKAEAEYNAAMAKIENKDKRYDLELKNIDTEHNSLQTEYDSIKTAIDKNIERTFKIYS